MSGVVEKIKDKVDQVLHKGDHNTHAAGTHTAGTHTTGTHTTGTTHAPGTHGHSTNTGPHSSNLANKADPHVDSDRDGSGNMGAANYGPGGNTTGTGFGTGAGTGTGMHPTSTTAGPHDSNIANKVDPRVDSDRDGSRNMGAANYGPGGHSTGTRTGMAGTGTHSGMAGSGTNTVGPHNSDLLNKVDPRVDSDRDGSRNMGAGNYGAGGQTTGTHTGMTGTGQTGTYTAGPHDSNLLNKVDPRVDSDRDGSRNMGAANYGAGGQATGTHTGMMGTGQSGMHAGTGPAPNTAGPHGSNLANKLDPRVDSGLDGSRTMGGDQSMGGNQTMGRNQTMGGNQNY